MAENYDFEIPQGGSKGTLLDYCFNNSTKQFLLKAGLSPGMSVLEIGCGSGEMSCWIAKTVSDSGNVLAIDNNDNQLKAAEKLAQQYDVHNISFKVHSAYAIENLNQHFDFIYCRFILHHLIKPRSVIHSIYQYLNRGGIIAAEEGIVNQGFTYPYTEAFGTERFSILNKHENFENKQRDGNFGIKLYHCLYQAGFKHLGVNLIQPTLTSKKEKSLLLASHYEYKQTFLAHGNSENEWESILNKIHELIDNNNQFVAFYQSCQVNGIK